MDDLPEKEPPRFWIAFTVLCAAFTLAFIMLVYNTIRAEAQQQCARMDGLIKGMEDAFHERKIWQGVKDTPQGPIETFLFQSESGSWTIVDVVGKDAAGKPVGCFVAVGKAGVPNELGKGV